MQKEVEEKKKKSVEDIKIYKTYLDFICYIEMLTEKYPKNIKNSFVPIIKKSLYAGMKNILFAYKVFEKQEKLTKLSELDINLKMLKVYARISYRKKYINIRNYEAWSRKLNNISIALGGWINSCLKQ